MVIVTHLVTMTKGHTNDEGAMIMICQGLALCLIKARGYCMYFCMMSGNMDQQICVDITKTETHEQEGFSASPDQFPYACQSRNSPFIFDFRGRLRAKTKMPPNAVGYRVDLQPIRAVL